MRLHYLSGYTLLALVLFRIAWGFVGSDTARFARFLRSPVAALRHLAEFRDPASGPRDRPQRGGRLDGARAAWRCCWRRR